MELQEWLRDTCAVFEFDVSAIYRRDGAHEWPLVGLDAADLQQKLAAGGHLLPLPREPAALANILEVRIVDFILERVAALNGAEASRGVERGYPDVEVGGEVFGGGYHAVDIKVARLNASGSATQSRVTLYTGNTYFRYPQLRWPGTFRPFRDYASHLDIVAVYRFAPEERERPHRPRVDSARKLADRITAALVYDAGVHRRCPILEGPSRGPRRVRLAGGVLPVLAPLSIPHWCRRSTATRPAAGEPRREAGP